ncbi:MAG TPA: TIGR02996 domain-containing protein [Gemmataceae bacterium]|jgi:uncharacterized protein (TIGR02996 family)
MASSLSRNSASIPPEVRMFFRDIKEHPDDDTPRLIFADWLQEHGDAAAAARGEFLRLQVLRHRLTPDDPNYGLLKRREGELFTEHCWTWLGPLADVTTWTFERGMIRLTARAQKIVLKTKIAEWARTEAGLWIDALALTNVVTAQAHVIHLARSPLLDHLNRLDLSDSDLRDSFFLLTQTHLLPFLTELVLPRNRLTAGHVTFLAQRPHFRRLTILDLQYNRLDDAAARLLVESPHLKNLATLRLGHNRFSAKGIALLRQAFGERVCL